MPKLLAPAVLAALLCGLAVSPAQAAAARGACPQRGTKTVFVARPAPGGFVTEEGSEIRLSGLLASDIGREAAAYLRAVGPLRIAPSRASDRYGRIRAQVFAGGTWVQGELLRLGLARAFLAPEDARCASALLAAEDEGRNARAGKWGDGAFAVLSAAALPRRGGSFQIVEAKVTGSAIVKGRAFINFGPDFRTDFTVTVAPEDMGVFRRAKFDIRALSGKRVRVRGFLDSYNGPEMEVALPAAIEILP